MICLIFENLSAVNKEIRPIGIKFRIVCAPQMQESRILDYCGWLPTNGYHINVSGRNLFASKLTCMTLLSGRHSTSRRSSLQRAFRTPGLA